MTKEDKSKLIPQELYANAYLEVWTDILGKSMKTSDLVICIKIKKMCQIIMKYHVQEQFI